MRVILLLCIDDKNWIRLKLPQLINMLGPTTKLLIQTGQHTTKNLT